MTGMFGYVDPIRKNLWSEEVAASAEVERARQLEQGAWNTMESLYMLLQLSKNKDERIVRVWYRAAARWRRRNENKFKIRRAA